MPNKNGNSYAADERSKGHKFDSLEPVAELVRCSNETPTHKAECRAGESRSDETLQGELNRLSGHVPRVMDPTKQNGQMPNKRRDTTCRQTFEAPLRISQISKTEDFKTEDGACPRGAENRRETSGEPREEECAPPLAFDPEKLRYAVGDGAAHLHGRPLPPCRTTEDMCDQSAKQDEWRQTKRHPLSWLVDFIENETCSAFDSTSESKIKEANRESAKRQKDDQAWSRLEQKRNGFKGDEKK